MWRQKTCYQYSSDEGPKLACLGPKIYEVAIQSCTKPSLSLINPQHTCIILSTPDTTRSIPTLPHFSIFVCGLEKEIYGWLVASCISRRRAAIYWPHFVPWRPVEQWPQIAKLQRKKEKRNQNTCHLWMNLWCKETKDLRGFLKANLW